MQTFFILSDHKFVTTKSPSLSPFPKERTVPHSLLIAVGGNSLIRAGQQGTIAEQFANARLTCESIADLAGRGFRIVITHGNGPQVGAQLLRSESGASQTYTLPLDVCGAMTQGEIGHILQTTLRSVLQGRNIDISVAALITHVLVDCQDPAFQHPTKPIGPFYTEESAREKSAELGWILVEDAARGYRRVVPSPKPCEIVERDLIEECLSLNWIVIAAGGGGIPVVGKNGVYRGVEAVIDKDRASALLASELGFETMIISTDVEYVCINFKQPDQKIIRRMNIREARGYLAQDEFREGSMKPKIEAAIEFLEQGGNNVIITSPEKLLEAIEGRTGTHIVKE